METKTTPAPQSGHEGGEILGRRSEWGRLPRRRSTVARPMWKEVAAWVAAQRASVKRKGTSQPATCWRWSLIRARRPLYLEYIMRRRWTTMQTRAHSPMAERAEARPPTRCPSATTTATTTSISAKSRPTSSHEPDAQPRRVGTASVPFHRSTRMSSCWQGTSHSEHWASVLLASGSRPTRRGRGSQSLRYESGPSSRASAGARIVSQPEGRFSTVTGDGKWPLGVTLATPG
mmetsp:Transcript_26824/g.71912  ORF Transcript_26824/g.71912 Transcript_26824/m.71912 type:complete len:232 (+) Transcript_26824:219-914(+)